MSAQEPILASVVASLRAVAEPSRLRLLAICSEGEWTVSELVQVMGQSQPRISRHLKVLADAGLLERIPEGAWVLYRATRDGGGGEFTRLLRGLLPVADAQLRQDNRRLEAVRMARREQAERWFDARAQGWDSERDLGVDAGAVESAVAALFEQAPAGRLLDIGTGTGRMLQLLAPHVGEGLGIDLSRDMLAVARANLDRAQLTHCQVRQGDMYQLPMPDGSAGAAVLHQVLHFADRPLAALSEARRVLAPGGRLVVVDLAAHDQEWLRSEKRHRRLGFSQAEMSGWLAELGLVERPAACFAGERLNVLIWVGDVPGGLEAARKINPKRNAA